VQILHCGKNVFQIFGNISCENSQKNAKQILKNHKTFKTTKLKKKTQ
jgi:hypothetical protein